MKSKELISYMTQHSKMFIDSLSKYEFERLMLNDIENGRSFISTMHDGEAKFRNISKKEFGDRGGCFFSYSINFMFKSNEYILATKRRWFKRQLDRELASSGDKKKKTKI